MHDIGMQCSIIQNSKLINHILVQLVIFIHNDMLIVTAARAGDGWFNPPFWSYQILKKGTGTVLAFGLA